MVLSCSRRTWGYTLKDRLNVPFAIRTRYFIVSLLSLLKEDFQNHQRYGWHATKETMQDM